MTSYIDVNARSALRDIEADHWLQKVHSLDVGLESKITATTKDKIVSLLDDLGNRLMALHMPVERDLQDVLDTLVGKSFDSLERNLAVTRRIRELLSRLGLRVVCPKEGCGRPAVLRCAAAGNSKTGVFQFDHSAEDRRTTHLGSSTFPRLKLIAAPPDRRRARA